MTMFFAIFLILPDEIQNNIDISILKYMVHKVSFCRINPSLQNNPKGLMKQILYIFFYFTLLLSFKDEKNEFYKYFTLRQF